MGSEQSFHSPAASESLSLAWPRESNQREGHPKAVVSGLLSSDCAARLRGFADSTSVCWQRTGRDPSRPPCGPFLRPAATAYGARLARILRARAKSKCNSQSQSPSSACGTFSRRAGEGRSGAEAKRDAAACGNLLRLGCAGGAVKWGPYAVAQRRRQGPQSLPRTRSGGGSHGCEPVGCQSTDGLSANPGAAARSRRAGCPETAASGWPSLWLLSLGHARESDSLAEGE